MTTTLPAPAWMFFAASVLGFSCVGMAQDNPIPSSNATAAQTSNVAPVYDSANNAGRMSSTRFSSAEDNARPGEYFFGLGANAFRHKDYVFAARMYEVAASWAYKPAQYDLGVMYARGQGVPADLPRALAWMTLAAERGDQQYVQARDLINAQLSAAQFARADVIWNQLKPTFADKSALRRAKDRWAQVRVSMTGSRVGSVAGELKIGVGREGASTMTAPSGTAGAALNHVGTGASDILDGEEVDGSIAYAQLLESDNPYDPKFESRPGSTGKVTVGPLTPIRKSGVKNPTASGNPSAAGSPNR